MPSVLGGTWKRAARASCFSRSTGAPRGSRRSVGLCRSSHSWPTSGSRRPARRCFSLSGSSANASACDVSAFSTAGLPTIRGPSSPGRPTSFASRGRFRRPARARKRRADATSRTFGTCAAPSTGIATRWFGPGCTAADYQTHSVATIEGSWEALLAQRRSRRTHRADNRRRRRRLAERGRPRFVIADDRGAVRSRSPRSCWRKRLAAIGETDRDRYARDPAYREFYLARDPAPPWARAGPRLGAPARRPCARHPLGSDLERSLPLADAVVTRAASGPDTRPAGSCSSTCSSGASSRACASLTARSATSRTRPHSATKATTSIG